MKSVIVVMSTYNGEQNIERQLDSIMNQKDVNVNIFIRDDQSSDNTIKVIKKYIDKNGYTNIQYIKGANEGYAKSFWDALCLCGNADYYAFSDQDDIWYDDKLIKCISPMEEENDDTLPKLSYCRMRRCDKNLVQLKEQVSILHPTELSKKIVLTQTYNYGAATVINNNAKKLVCRCLPDSNRIPHDAWIGLLCYWFGKVYYVDEALYDWIRYDSSVTGAGTKFSGILFRIKETLNGKSYGNVSRILLNYYNDCLEIEDRIFLKMLDEYKNNFSFKRKIFMDSEFKRTNVLGTIMLKIGVLFNKL